MLRTTQATAVPVGARGCSRQRYGAAGDGRLGAARTANESSGWTATRAQPAKSGTGRCFAIYC
jgi:hypothetical protein